MTINISLEELTNTELTELAYDITDVYRLLAEHIKYRIYHDDFEIECTDKEHVTLIFD